MPDRVFWAAATGIMLLAAVLTFHALSQPARFHPDEAFFMTFARNAAVNGDWLLPGPLDKPPLTMYLNALALIGLAVSPLPDGVLTITVQAGEFAGRVPSALLSFVLVAAGITIARHLLRDRQAALWVGGLLALSPLRIAFAPTAFTDMPMLALGVLAWALILRGRGLWAGIVFGLAFAAKPQAIFLLPLLTIQGDWRRHARRFALGGLAVIAPVLLWDVARPETSIFALGAVNNAPPGWIAPPGTWLDRLLRWWDGLGWALGTPAITAGLLLIGTGRNVTQPTRTGLLLLMWLIAYSGLHIITTSNIYDRYALVALPVVALVAAHAVFWLPDDRRRWLAIALVGLVALPGAWQAADLRVPVGGDRGQRAGIIELADYLNDLPVATVIYDRWLGWDLGYYMGQWTNKRRVYYPTPAALVAGALSLPETGPRYLVAPRDAPYLPYLVRLAEAGFQVRRAWIAPRFVVYRLLPP